MTKTEVLQKLTRDLEMRGRSIETIKEYTTKVRLFQDYFGKSADQMGEKEILDYLYYLVAEKKISPQSVNTYNSALRFVYSVTLDVVLNYKKLPRLKQNRRIPQIFTKEEIRKILDSADGKIHRVMLMLAYGSGLRLSEITNLKASDIELDKCVFLSVREKVTVTDMQCYHSQHLIILENIGGNTVQKNGCLKLPELVAGIITVHYRMHLNQLFEDRVLKSKGPYIHFVTVLPLTCMKMDIICWH